MIQYRAVHLRKISDSDFNIKYLFICIAISHIFELEKKLQIKMKSMMLYFLSVQLINAKTKYKRIRNRIRFR